MTTDPLHIKQGPPLLNDVIDMDWVTLERQRIVRHCGRFRRFYAILVAVVVGACIGLGTLQHPFVEYTKSAKADFCEKQFGPFNELVALQSFPGSGNTWMRSMIEDTFGYYTGSVYRDRYLFNSGMRGEYKSPYSRETIVQKIHQKKLKPGNGQRYPSIVAHCIFLLRNPVDAYISEFQRRVKTSQAHHNNFTGNPHAEALSENEFDYKVFRKQFKKKSKVFFREFQYFYHQCKDSRHIVFYEELKEGKVELMINLQAYLQKVHDMALPIRDGCKSGRERHHRNTNAFEKIRRYNVIISGFKRSFKKAYNEQLDFIDDILGEEQQRSLPPGYYLHL